MRFRRNMERSGQIFAYEISKELPFTPGEVITPLGTAAVQLMREWPVLVTILRAGVPFHQGMLSYFDHADSGFISAYRKVKKSKDFEIKMEYISVPDLNGRTVILSDPMLATGRSMVTACQEILGDYKPRALHIATVIASAEGVEHVKAFVPGAVLWVGAVDDEMTSKAYIVPGLGDAGDLAYGKKQDEV